MNLGPHAGFIVASYGAVAIGLIGLLAWLFIDSRQLRAALADLDARGIRRRPSSDGAEARETDAA